jgi:hypothetical protein
MTLTHMGMETPFTLTSHPNATRTRCANATRKKTTTATVEMGFKWYPVVLTKADSNSCLPEHRFRSSPHVGVHEIGRHNLLLRDRGDGVYENDRVRRARVPRNSDSAKAKAPITASHRARNRCFRSRPDEA